LTFNKYYFYLLLLGKKIKYIYTLPPKGGSIISPTFSYFRFLLKFIFFIKKVFFEKTKIRTSRKKKYLFSSFKKLKLRVREDAEEGNLNVNKTLNFYYLRESYTFNKITKFFIQTNLFFLQKNIFSLSKTSFLLDYNYLMQFFFFKIFNFFFHLNFLNVNTMLDRDFLVNSSKFLVRMVPKKFGFIYFVELSEILISGVITKNLFFLYRWIKYNIEKRSLKMFSSIKRFLRALFMQFFFKLNSYFSLKGFYLKFKGKFIKGGGRKKKQIFKYGEYSSNNKSLRLVYKVFHLRTISGIIGCTLKLAY